MVEIDYRLIYLNQQVHRHLIAALVESVYKGSAIQRTRTPSSRTVRSRSTTRRRYAPSDGLPEPSEQHVCDYMNIRSLPAMLSVAFIAATHYQFGRILRSNSRGCRIYWRHSTRWCSPSGCSLRRLPALIQSSSSITRTGRRSLQH